MPPSIFASESTKPTNTTAGVTTASAPSLVAKPIPFSTNINGNANLNVNGGGGGGGGDATPGFSPPPLFGQEKPQQHAQQQHPHTNPPPTRPPAYLPQPPQSDQFLQNKNSTYIRDFQEGIDILYGLSDRSKNATNFSDYITVNDDSVFKTLLSQAKGLQKTLQTQQLQQQAAAQAAALASNTHNSINNNNPFAYPSASSATPQQHQQQQGGGGLATPSAGIHLLRGVGEGLERGGAAVVGGVTAVGDAAIAALDTAVLGPFRWVASNVGAAGKATATPTTSCSDPTPNNNNIGHNNDTNNNNNKDQRGDGVGEVKGAPHARRLTMELSTMTNDGGVLDLDEDLLRGDGEGVGGIIEREKEKVDNGDDGDNTDELKDTTRRRESSERGAEDDDALQGTASIVLRSPSRNHSHDDDHSTSSTPPTTTPLKNSKPPRSDNNTNNVSSCSGLDGMNNDTPSVPAEGTHVEVNERTTTVEDDDENEERQNTNQNLRQKHDEDEDEDEDGDDKDMAPLRLSTDAPIPTVVKTTAASVCVSPPSSRPPLFPPLPPSSAAAVSAVVVGTTAPSVSSPSASISPVVAPSTPPKARTSAPPSPQHQPQAQGEHQPAAPPPLPPLPLPPPHAHLPVGAVRQGTAIVPTTAQRHVSVQAIHPLEFAAMRYLYADACPEDVLVSLLRCEDFAPGSGQSHAGGKAFYKTSDQRYILKQVKRIEAQHFMVIAPDYFAHMAQMFTEQHHVATEYYSWEDKAKAANNNNNSNNTAQPSASVSYALPTEKIKASSIPARHTIQSLIVKVFGLYAITVSVPKKGSGGGGSKRHRQQQADGSTGMHGGGGGGDRLGTADGDDGAGAPDDAGQQTAAGADNAMGMGRRADDASASAAGSPTTTGGGSGGPAGSSDTNPTAQSPTTAAAATAAATTTHRSHRIKDPDATGEVRYFILMENLLMASKTQVQRVFDLKGSQIRRYANEDEATTRLKGGGNTNKVTFMDENMINRTRAGFFFYVNEDDSSWLKAVFQRDTELLARSNIMDYSLIAGMERSTDERRYVVTEASAAALRSAKGEFSKPTLSVLPRREVEVAERRRRRAQERQETDEILRQISEIEMQQQSMAARRRAQLQQQQCAAATTTTTTTASTNNNNNIITATTTTTSTRRGSCAAVIDSLSTTYASAPAHHLSLLGGLGGAAASGDREASWGSGAQAPPVGERRGGGGGGAALPTNHPTSSSTPSQQPLGASGCGEDGIGGGGGGGGGGQSLNFAGADTSSSPLDGDFFATFSQRHSRSHSAFSGASSSAAADKGISGATTSGVGGPKRLIGGTTPSPSRGGGAAYPSPGLLHSANVTATDNTNACNGTTTTSHGHSRSLNRRRHLKSRSASPAIALIRGEENSNNNNLTEAASALLNAVLDASSKSRAASKANSTAAATLQRSPAASLSAARHSPSPPARSGGATAAAAAAAHHCPPLAKEEEASSIRRGEKRGKSGREREKTGVDDNGDEACEINHNDYNDEDNNDVDALVIAPQSAAEPAAASSSSAIEFIDDLPSHGLLHLGIIDYLHPYSWSKKSEQKLKEMKNFLFLKLANRTLGEDYKQPTIIEPYPYKQRFERFMGQYFCCVPSKLSMLRKNYEGLLRRQRRLNEQHRILTILREHEERERERKEALAAALAAAKAEAEVEATEAKDNKGARSSAAHVPPSTAEAESPPALGVTDGDHVSSGFIVVKQDQDDCSNNNNNINEPTSSASPVRNNGSTAPASPTRVSNSPLSPQLPSTHKSKEEEKISSDFILIAEKEELENRERAKKENGNNERDREKEEWSKDMMAPTTTTASSSITHHNENENRVPLLSPQRRRAPTIAMTLGGGIDQKNATVLNNEVASPAD